MNEVEIYQDKGLSLQVGNNINVQDIKNSSLSSDVKTTILSARCYPTIRSMKGVMVTEGEFAGIEKRQMEIRQHINKTILDSGYGTSLSEEELANIIVSVLNDVLRFFSFLTTQEVGIAFSKGCREEYGEYKGVNTRIFYLWLKAYCASTKMNANKALIKLDEPKEIEPDQKEKERRQQVWLEDMYKEFDEFVKTGKYTLYDTGNLFYDYLKELGLIDLSKNEKKAVWKLAKESLFRQYDPDKVNDKYKVAGYQKFINQLEEGDKSIEHKISMEAKRISLMHYLSSLRKEGKSLKEEITKKTRQT